MAGNLTNECAVPEEVSYVVYIIYTIFTKSFLMLTPYNLIRWHSSHNFSYNLNDNSCISGSHFVSIRFFYGKDSIGNKETDPKLSKLGN